MFPLQLRKKFNKRWLSNAVWVLVWLQITAGQSVDYFQLGTYKTLEECKQQQEIAKVMIIHSGIAVECFKVDVND